MERQLTEETLAAAITNELNESLGGSVGTNDSELTGVWENALNYYYGKKRGDEVKGRSAVISMDMADMIEQTLAQILPAFDKDDLGQFYGPDAKQAQQESTAVNYIVMQQNNGFTLLTEAIKDSFLQRNGIVKVYVDSRIEIEIETFENVPDLMLPQLLQPTEQNQKVEVIEQEIVQEAVFDEFGVIAQAGVVSLTIRRSTPRKKLVAEVVPPEEIAVNGDHNSIFLENARFVAHTKIETESSLIEQGFPPEVVKQLKTYTQRTESDERARSRDEEENEFETAHHSNRNIQVSECYYLIDWDNDGIAERRKILISGGTILENEWFPCVPFAAGTPYIMPHRFWGLSFYDKLRQTQDIKTSFLRKTLDNAEGLINQRVIAINGQVNMDDLLASRPTGVVRAKTQGAVTPYPVQNMGDTGFKMLTYMDKIRKEAAGSQLDIGTSENVPVAGQTAHGMERWMTSKEHLPAFIAQTLAETLVRGIYYLTHKLVKRYMPEEFQYEMNGQQMSAQPGRWQYGEKLKIVIDTTVAEKQKMFQSLDLIISQQMTAIENGTSLATIENIYNALFDQARLAGHDNPERYWIDPASPQAQQLAQRSQQAAEQNAAEAQAEADKLYQTQLLTTQMQEDTDKMKAILKDQIDKDEQFRKWVELELEYSKDVPNRGLEGGQ